LFCRAVPVVEADDLHAVLYFDTFDNLGNCFSPCSQRQVFEAAMASLNIISFAV
jgi:hypothetical protein